MTARELFLLGSRGRLGIRSCHFTDFVTRWPAPSRARGRQVAVGLRRGGVPRIPPLLITIRQLSEMLVRARVSTDERLEAVVDFYDAGGRSNPHIDPELHPLHLTASEKQAVIAFLHSLSGTVSEGVDGRNRQGP